VENENNINYVHHKYYSPAEHQSHLKTEPFSDNKYERNSKWSEMQIYKLCDSDRHLYNMNTYNKKYKCK
jgi:hypothetical protein